MAKKLQALFWFASLAAVGAAVWLLLIPADSKNALLLGYSASRLGLLLACLASAALLAWPALHLGRSDKSLRKWMPRLEKVLAGPAVVWVVLLASLALVIAGLTYLSSIFSLPDAAANKAFLMRLAPVLTMVALWAAGFFVFLVSLKRSYLVGAIRAGVGRSARSKVGRWAGVLLVNLLILAGLLYGLEAVFRATDHCVQVRKDIPFDTNDYYIHPECYAGKEIPAEGKYTWGELIVTNSYGFREEEIVTPKPADVCRIMVLGDSFTWGVGLPVEERYSNLVEAKLNASFPDQQFEVLNFALSGAATTEERDVLAEYKDLAQPDLVVVGFFYNDPEPPRGSELRSQADPFEKKYGETINAVTGFLKGIGLPFMAVKLDAAVHSFAVRAEAAEEWYVIYDAYYDPDSQAWKDFETALADIFSMTQAMGNPMPVFAVLTNEMFTIDEMLVEKYQYMQRWQRQAEQAALSAGFRTLNYDEEMLSQVTVAALYVNQLDMHPSAKVNQVFAEKLFESLADLFRQGDLCAQ
ncbi:MAG: SGNH/GDSL hydrolase family protein [Anaerolineales bacterium]